MNPPTLTPNIPGLSSNYRYFFLWNFVEDMLGNSQPLIFTNSQWLHLPVTFNMPGSTWWLLAHHYILCQQ
jgi:hypothetical protein